MMSELYVWACAFLRGSPRRLVTPVIGISISAIFLYLIFGRLSFREALDVSLRADIGFLLIGIGSLVCGYCFRIARWWIMLRAHSPEIRWSEAAAYYLSGIAANNLLPLRAGDFLRMFAFRGRSGLEPGRVAGTLLVERLLDVVALLLILSLSFALTAGQLVQFESIWYWLIGGTAAAAIAIFLLPLLDRKLFGGIRRSSWVANRPILRSAFDATRMLAETVSSLGRPRRLAALAALSGAAWVFEAGLFVAVLAAFDPPKAVTPGIVALTMATLATLIPSSPGYVGTFHFFAMQAVLVFGIDQTVSAAFALTVHMLLWLPTTIAGLVALLWISIASPASPSSREFSAPP
jgi:uncharacterized protein (TIRG00374 family)